LELLEFGVMTANTEIKETLGRQPNLIFAGYRRTGTLTICG
jgi:hypothetical protein